MTVKIGHAYSDENKSAKGGVSGDQTGNEVKIQNWYNRSKGWSAVFRPKDSTVAEKIATAMEQACANNKIGYDQSQRTTLYAKAKEKNWDLSKIVSSCECDCSSLVAVCVNAAGIAISKDMYTGNQKAVLMATGQFELLTDSQHLTYDKYLKRGDILLGTGHTAVVLSDGDCAKQSEKTSKGEKTVNIEMAVLKKGAKGEQVKTLQILLNAELKEKLGNKFAPLAVDGSFGAKTLAAVKQFQERYGLAVDGSVGAATWNRLLGVK